MDGKIKSSRIKNSCNDFIIEDGIKIYFYEMTKDKYGWPNIPSDEVLKNIAKNKKRTQMIDKMLKNNPSQNETDTDKR